MTKLVAIQTAAGTVFVNPSDVSSLTIRDGCAIIRMRNGEEVKSLQTLAEVSRLVSPSSEKQFLMD